MAELANRDQEERRVVGSLLDFQGRYEKRLKGELSRPEGVSPEFWAEYQEDLEQVLLHLLLALFIAAASQKGASPDQALLLGSAYSSTRSRAVAAGFVADSRDMARDFRSQFPSGSPSPTGADIDEITDKILGEGRTERMGVTETTAAAVTGMEATVARMIGLSEDDTWYTRNDSRVCPICEPLHQTRRSHWGSLYPQGPPAHPRCRCWIEYANEKRRNP